MPTPTPSESLTLRKTLPCSPEQAFRAWTDPEQFQQWFVALDRLTLFLEPARHRGFGDGFAHRRNLDVGAHVRASVLNVEMRNQSDKASLRKAASSAWCCFIRPAAVEADSARPA